MSAAVDNEMDRLTSPAVTVPSGHAGGWRALIPNLITLSRAGVGICFPWIPPEWRVWMIVVAALSDVADGAASRLLRVNNGTGRYLDPIVDKVFVLGVVIALVRDGIIAVPEVLLIGLRDIAVMAGTVVLLVQGKSHILARLTPTVLGKLTTAAQFLYFGVLLVASQRPFYPFVAVTLLSGAAALDYMRLALSHKAR